MAVFRNPREFYPREISPREITGRTTRKPTGDPFGTGTYRAALETQASDYDEIMQRYRDLLSSRAPIQQLQYTPITPQLGKYTEDPRLASALSRFSSLAETGGYTPSGIANIRARGVSPIRSIYASAQRNLARQKNLQGGYAPNFAAASTRMARELSEQIGQRTTDVEAGIAENVARGRLSAMGIYAPLAAQEAKARRDIETYNLESIRRAEEQNRLFPLQYEEFNREGLEADYRNQLGTIEGMRGLYGTTPALASTFGQQVLQARQLEQGEDERDNDEELALNFLSRFGTPPRYRGY